MEWPSFQKFWKLISDCFAKCKNNVKVACHGCSKKCDIPEFQRKSFKDIEGSVEVILCNDCLQDEKKLTWPALLLCACCKRFMPRIK